ncbi:uncharacterized protein LOC118191964 [Stegodyphus dumicola]|uniref:uncharacterized protein LOC118191964 n=1 Tax=Stegodyphus dumicola TaxID=202533 RepID=UPI0015AFA685|nr:uncharacterized protein LOC118191964 [Stegodyphus dumicola]
MASNNPAEKKQLPKEYENESIGFECGAQVFTLSNPKRILKGGIELLKSGRLWFQLFWNLGLLIILIMIESISPWGTHLTKGAIKRLNALQRPHLLIISKAYRTTHTSTAALQILTGLPPLPLMVQREETIANVVRLQKLQELWNDHFHPDDYELQQSNDAFHPASFDLQQNVFIKTSNPLNSDFQIYRDGSQMSSRTGSGFAAYNTYLSVFNINSIHPALRKAVEYRRTNVCVGDLDIFTEGSGYDNGIEALADVDNTNILVSYIKDLLVKVEKINEVKMNWAKAQIDVTGNEKADMLAKEAAVDNTGNALDIQA